MTTILIIRIAFSLGIVTLLFCFPEIIFNTIDKIDYRLKQFIAWGFTKINNIIKKL